MKTRRQIIAAAACAVAGIAMPALAVEAAMQTPIVPSLDDVIAFLKEKWSKEESRFLPFNPPKELASRFWALDTNDWEVIQNRIKGIGRLYITGNPDYFLVDLCVKNSRGIVAMQIVSDQEPLMNAGGICHRSFRAKNEPKYA